LFERFVEALAMRFRYVLIDSRTDLNDTSGICTMLLPERLVTVDALPISAGGKVDKARLRAAAATRFAGGDAGDRDERDRDDRD